MSLKDFVNTAGFYDVARQSGYPRNVVNLQEILDTPSDDDIRTLVESARDEAPSEYRRGGPEANCDLSGSIFRPGERLNVPALRHWSRVVGVASLIRAIFTPA